MYLELNADASALEQVYQSGDLSRFLTETARLFLAIESNADLKGRAFFEASSDRRMEDLANWLVRPSPSPRADTVVHVATEVYAIGGHTRVMEDIVRAMPDRRHVLILTDLSGRYSRGQASLDILEHRFEDMGLEVRWLPQGEILNRVFMLIAMVAELSPGAIFVNAHPFDTVAYAGISGKSAPRVLLLHHADHYPALGSARTDYTHLDLSDICHSICCSSHLHEPKLLSMSVQDNGAISPDYDRPLVGVVSGNYNKFEGSVGATYAELLTAILGAGVETMHHIGTLHPPQIDQIHMAMDMAGIDRDRVVFHGSVPSLSLKIKDIEPNFALNSHPMGGGKAAIEALSLGLPFMHYSPPEKLPIFDWVDGMGGCIRLRDLSEAPEAVREMEKRGAEIGKANRRLYESRHTMEAFGRSLKELTAF